MRIPRAQKAGKRPSGRPRIIELGFGVRIYGALQYVVTGICDNDISVALSRVFRFGVSNSCL